MKNLGLQAILIVILISSAPAQANDTLENLNQRLDKAESIIENAELEYRQNIIRLDNEEQNIELEYQQGLQRLRETKTQEELNDFSAELKANIQCMNIEVAIWKESTAFTKIRNEAKKINAYGYTDDLIKLIEEYHNQEIAADLNNYNLYCPNHPIENPRML